MQCKKNHARLLWKHKLFLGMRKKYTKPPKEKIIPFCEYSPLGSCPQSGCSRTVMQLSPPPPPPTHTCFYSLPSPCHFFKGIYSDLSLCFWVPDLTPGSPQLPCLHWAIVCYTTLVVWPPGCPLGNWACSLGTCFAQASARGMRNASKEAFKLLILAVLLFWKTTEQWEGGKFHSLRASLLSSGNNSNEVHFGGNCLNQVLSCIAWNKAF